MARGQQRQRIGLVVVLRQEALRPRRERITSSFGALPLPVAWRLMVATGHAEIGRGLALAPRGETQAGDILR